MLEVKQQTNVVKRKIVKFTGAVVIAGALAVGGLAIYDSMIDHTKEVDAVRATHILDFDSAEEELKSVLLKLPVADGVEQSYISVTDYVEVGRKTLEDGTFLYYVPSGYTLEGTKGKKTSIVPDYSNTVLTIHWDENNKAFISSISVLDKEKNNDKKLER